MITGLVTDANRKWWTLAAVTFCLFMVMLDTTIVNVALPAIQADLKLKQSSLEWTVNGFLLPYASLLLPGGKLADLFGRRLLLIVGVGVFTAASIVCGLSNSDVMLITARAAMGVGAGLMMPATHSLISANFSESEHGIAYGAWAGISTLGLALGPLVGGLLVQKASWPWIFYVNAPAGILAIVITRLVVRESKDLSTEQGLDPAGLLVSSVALFALIFGLVEGHSYGWTSTTIAACFIVTAVALPVFVLLEWRQRRPMMDLSLFRQSTFTGANVVTLLVMFTMLGILFFASLYLQKILGYSPIQAGATFLPWTVVFLLVSPVAGIFGDRLGFRWPVSAGMALLAVGLYLFSRVDATTTFWQLLPPLIIGGIGTGIATAPVTAAAMTATPVDKSGVGAGVLVTFRQVGGALGVAIMGAIVAGKLGHFSLTSRRGAPLFIDGFQDSLKLAAAVSLGGALVALVTIKRIPHVVAPPRPTGAQRLASRLAPVALSGPPALTAVRQVVSRAVAVRDLVLDAPAVLVRSGPLAGQRFPVESELSLGRAGADIMLEDPEVSRRHARLRPVDGEVEIEDLGSVNGTFVNGERITAPRRLGDGDVVALGRVSLQVEVPLPLRAAPTVQAGVQAAAAAPVLHVTEGPLAGERFPVERELSLGRENTEIVLEDREVSRRHALARPVEGGVEIVDLGSVNGTFVNGERIDQPWRLSDGDVVRLGRTSLRAEVPVPARAAPTVHAGVATVTPPTLIVKDGPLAGERFPVEAELSLGRQDTAIVLDDPEISRRHALARPVDGSVEIEDLGSVNGTFVNGERIDRPRRLSDGDVIRLGHVSLEVEVPERGPGATVASSVAAEPMATTPSVTDPERLEKPPE